MKRFITSLLLLAAIIVPGALTPQAMGQGNQQPYALEDAINTPVIKDRKARNSILSYQNSAKEELTSMSSSYRSVDGGILGITVATARDGEVIVISIPAELLFEPNSPDLSDEASRILRQYTSLMRAPDFYRMVLAMHHDNSGSRQYAESLTQKRVNSVYDWFATHTSPRFISYYACGNEMPAVDNNSILNRRFNRRLEIYLVPGEAMIEQGKKGNLR